MNNYARIYSNLIDTEATTAFYLGIHYVQNLKTWTHIVMYLQQPILQTFTYKFG